MPPNSLNNPSKRWGVSALSELPPVVPPEPTFTATDLKAAKDAGFKQGVDAGKLLERDATKASLAAQLQRARQEAYQVGLKDGRAQGLEQAKTNPLQRPQKALVPGLTGRQIVRSIHSGPLSIQLGGKLHA